MITDSAIERRFEDWAKWIDCHLAGLGWCVSREHVDDFRVQLRNDVHADKVFAEVARFNKDDLRALETHAIWESFPKSWRRYLSGRFVFHMTHAEIAREMGVDHRALSRKFPEVCDEFRDRLSGTISSMRYIEGAQGVVSCGKIC